MSEAVWTDWLRVPEGEKPAIPEWADGAEESAGEAGYLYRYKVPSGLADMARKGEVKALPGDPGFSMQHEVILKVRSDLGLPPLSNDPAAHYQNHYKGVKLDPYRIADIYQIPAGPRWQILKKTLRGTTKGQSEQEVINEIRSALDRWQEMVEEDYG